MKKEPKIVSQLLSLLLKAEQKKEWRDLVLTKIQQWQEKIKRKTILVISAVPLAKEELKQIEIILKREIKDSIIIRPVVKENILGGIKIIIGSQVIDFSIAGQLDEFQTKVKQLMKNEQK